MSVRARSSPAVVTIGMFDGVHLGHQHLMARTVRVARRHRGRSIGVTFNPDPQRVLDPARAHPPLMPLRRRVALMRERGLDRVIVISFTRAFAALTPEQFVARILVRRLQAQVVVIGANFAFGKNRRGDVALLRRLGARHGMRVITVPAVTRGGSPVSSSRIRRLVLDGRLPEAQRLLGRPFELSGIVVRGSGRAMRLGFPTANIRLDDTLRPPQGVYRVQLMWARRQAAGLMNLGVRPTFGRGPVVCEVHLPTFRGHLYGQSVRVACGSKLRDERRFESPHALAAQIRQDLLHAGFSAS